MDNTYKYNEIKLFPKSTGVYLIYFDKAKNIKYYIGSTSAKTIRKINGFYRRWQVHLLSLKNKKHHSKKLQNAFNKYGIENIRFKIVEECEPLLCVDREQFYINKFNSFNKGYNGRPTADSNLGFNQSEKQKTILRNRAKEKRDIIFTKINDLYSEGKTTREISVLLKISRGVITKVFKENNIEKRNTASYTKKKLYQYSIDGHLLNEWDSLRKCSENLKIQTNTIRMVINGRCKHSGGFYFSLNKITKEEVINNINKLTIKSKNRKYFDIKQCDEFGNVIKEWRDIKEIIDFYKFTSINNLLKILKKEKIGYYKGYYWEIK